MKWNRKKNEDFSNILRLHWEVYIDGDNDEDEELLNPGDQDFHIKSKI